MSADIESMFSVREVPWHGVGTIVPEALTAKEALVAAGLEWEVSLQPTFTRVINTSGDIVTATEMNQPPTWTDLEIPGQFAVVRDTDRSILGTVGSRYKPVQNSEAFSFFDSLVDSGDAKYETAGALAGGRRVFLTALMPREVLIAGEKSEEHRIYLVLATSHDGSLAFTAAVTPVRVVCQNTLNLALGTAKQAWSMRHVDSIDGKIAEARNTLGMTFAYVDAFEADMNRLVEAEFTKRQFEQLVKDVFPGKTEGQFTPDQYAMIGVLESSPTIADGIRYTKYGALQAMTEYADWGRAVRSSKDRSEGESRLQEVWFGKAPSTKSKFHAALVAAS